MRSGGGSACDISTRVVFARIAVIDAVVLVVVAVVRLRQRGAVGEHVGADPNDVAGVGRGAVCGKGAIAQRIAGDLGEHGQRGGGVADDFVHGAARQPGRTVARQQPHIARRGRWGGVLGSSLTQLLSQRGDERVTGRVIAGAKTVASGRRSDRRLDRSVMVFSWIVRPGCGPCVLGSAAAICVH